MLVNIETRTRLIIRQVKMKRATNYIRKIITVTFCRGREKDFKSQNTESDSEDWVQGDPRYVTSIPTEKKVTRYTRVYAELSLCTRAPVSRRRLSQGNKEIRRTLFKQFLQIFVLFMSSFTRYSVGNCNHVPNLLIIIIIINNYYNYTN